MTNCTEIVFRPISAEPVLKQATAKKPASRPWISFGTTCMNTSANTVEEHSTRQRNLRYSTSSLKFSVDHYLTQTFKTKEVDYFYFDSMPSLCKSLVFQNLSIFDRGHARIVCKDWYNILSSPALWNVIDLSVFELCNVKSVHACDRVCYQNYKRRIRSYVAFICWVRPSVKSLRFSLDIGDMEDGWILLIEQMLSSMHCGILRHANINWKETLVKPFWVDNTGWQDKNYKQLIVRHHYRQKMFVRFFEEFTSLTVNLTTLIIPLFWSEECIQCLGRIKSLKSLTIQKYFVFQLIDQHLLDKLFIELPNLEKLVLKTWMPSGHGLHLYTFFAPKLQYLDISQSRGLFIGTLIAPELAIFKVLRHTWNGPLTNVNSLNIPCLYNVLRVGAPKLNQINEFCLHTDWAQYLHDDMDAMFKVTCSCKKHKRSWNMGNKIILEL